MLATLISVITITTNNNIMIILIIIYKIIDINNKYKIYIIIYNKLTHLISVFCSCPLGQQFFNFFKFTIAGCFEQQLAIRSAHLLIDLKSGLTQVMMMKMVARSRHLKTVSPKIGVEDIHNINNDAEIIELNLVKDFYFNCQLTKDLVTVTVKFVS